MTIIMFILGLFCCWSGLAQFDKSTTWLELFKGLFWTAIGIILISGFITEVAK